MMKFKEQAKRIMKFFRLTDDNGMLSLTNITMILVMYKVATVPAVSMSDITALALGVMGYQVKRYIEK